MLVAGRNGKLAVVACEGELPADCAADWQDELDPDGDGQPNDLDGDVDASDTSLAIARADRPGSIYILDLRRGPGRIQVAAVVTVDAVFNLFFTGDPSRASEAKLIEPEYAEISPDSSYALVSLQGQSAIAVIDLNEVLELSGEDDLSPEQIGAASLVDVVMLPHGPKGSNGKPAGVQPDGISFSHDGRHFFSAIESEAGRWRGWR